MEFKAVSRELVRLFNFALINNCRGTLLERRFKIANTINHFSGYGSDSSNSQDKRILVTAKNFTLFFARKIFLKISFDALGGRIKIPILKVGKLLFQL